MKLRLAQVAEVRLGRQRSPQYEQGDHIVPYLRSANVVDGRLDLGDVKSMNFDPVEQVIFGLTDGDVLMTEGSGSAETVGTSAVWRTDIPGTVCFQNTLLRLRPRAEITDGRFLAWWARHAHASGQIAAVSTGANIQHIGADGLKDLGIHVPELEEQRRIADFLDDRVARIDQIITARRKQLGDLEALRAATLVSHIFEVGDALVPCKAYAEVRLGRQRAPMHESGDHMLPYLRSANVSDGTLLLDDVKTMNFEPSEQAIFTLLPGDVLVTEGSASAEAIGASAVWEDELSAPVCFQNTLLRLRARNDCDPDFLALWARASHASGAARTFAGGASILHLGADGMSKLPIPRIPLTVQRDRSARARAGLEAAEGLGSRLSKSVCLLTQYKQSLITAAVTGEIDVRTAGSGIPG